MFTASYRRRSMWSEFSDWLRSWAPRRTWSSQLRSSVDVDELTNQVANRLGMSLRSARHMSRSAMRDARRAGRQMARLGGDTLEWAGRPNVLKIGMVVAGLGLLALWAGRR